MPNINQNIVDLGHVPVNRGTWEDWTAEQQSELRFYKDNIVQQGDSSYIASPVGYDPVSNPEAYVQGPPYNTTTHSINTGWKLFANGIDEFQTGERVSETSIATGTDFDNPDATKRAKVPTVGAVLDGISEGAFDLTAKTGDSYATLADALAAANSVIPANKKRGGMSIKFVQNNCQS